MRNGGIVEKFHANGITGSDFRNLGFGGVAERAQVAAEVAVVGGQVVKGVGELGGHVAFAAGSLANVLPVLGDFTIQNELAEDVVRRCRGGQRRCSREKSGKVLHRDIKSDDERERKMF